MTRLNHFFLKFIFISPCVICVITFFFMNMIALANSTQICVRNPPFGKIFITDSAKFEEFLYSSKLYIDKTELIASLLLDGLESVLLRTVDVTTFPRRFGKTLNMLMIQFFFQIEVYPNNTIVPQKMSKSYQFFTTGKFKYGNGDEVAFVPKPLLSDSKYEKMVKMHCAKYPVIRVEFKGLTIYSSFSFDNFLQKFAKSIDKMFSSHMYLKEHFMEEMRSASSSLDRKSAEEDLEFFYKATTWKLNEQELIDSIIRLSKMLKKRFSDTNVIILIDEYDSIINQLYLRGEQYTFEFKDKVQKFYVDFLVSTLHHNCENYQRAILTGIMNIKDASIFSGLNYLTHYHMFSSDINRFYGISKSEADELYDIYNIESEIRGQVEKFYDGYKYPTENGQFERFYNTFSIVNFLNNAKKGIPVSGYWTGTGIIDLNIHRMMMIPSVRTKLEPVFTKNDLFVTMWNANEYHYSASNYLIFSLREIQSLEEMSDVQSNFKQDTRDDADIFFRLFLATGYLTWDGSDLSSPRFTFPNEEVATHLAMQYRMDYERSYGRTYVQLADEFIKFIFNEESQSKELESAFVEFNKANKHSLIPHIAKSDRRKDYSITKPPGTISAIEINEAYFASVLRAVSIYIRARKLFISFEYPVKRGTIDLYFHDYEGKEAIIELKYEASHRRLGDAFSQLGKYETGKNYKTKYIAILGKTDGSIEVLATFVRPTVPKSTQKSRSTTTTIALQPSAERGLVED